ncbi:MAG: lysine--tRNA ligase [Candidatus Cloacimonadota bacterium]|nr:MAG: lysine--tRNA ligase [Candidatus Cloacimonadota bacterium]RLC55219.1 MAG: lysine--tRNA ligase [Candidatus Cloacimonadota bacterium]
MENINQLLKVRREKLEKVRELGINPYPNRCKRTHKIGELIEKKDKFLESGEKVIIAGRLNAMRRQGKVGFGNVSDNTGKIQLFVRKDTVGEENYEIFKLLDLGDFVQIEGECFVTQKGEYSVRAHEVTMLGKTLRPLPTVKEKIVDGQKVRYDEFSDIELRFRKRYLDLLLNPEVKDTFVIRARMIKAMRDFLDAKGFIEVETPTLQPLYGGANARPFITHHNTLDIDLYMRIALELYLKRLIVGGIERVYEIGKNFRNEGMDRTHNPEFSMIELYQSYTDIDGMMEITEDMILHVAKEVFGKESIDFLGTEIHFKKPWRRTPMIDLIKEETGFDASDFDFEKIKAFCKEHEIEIEPTAGPGKLIEEIFSVFVEPKLIQPTFVIDFPKEVSPLAKEKPGNPLLTERFELFINGNEYGNAFTELNDPIDQRARLEAQSKLREMGDVEANVVDEDFLEALEYGMPPTGGLGIGIDRLVMLFTGNTSIKEVILFPQMKPEE